MSWFYKKHPVTTPMASRTIEAKSHPENVAVTLGLCDQTEVVEHVARLALPDRCSFWHEDPQVLTVALPTHVIFDWTVEKGGLLGDGAVDEAALPCPLPIILVEYTSGLVDVVSHYGGQPAGIYGPLMDYAQLRRVRVGPFLVIDRSPTAQSAP